MNRTSKCQHNEGVDCAPQLAEKCAVCGFNPKVNAKRMKHIAAKGLVLNDKTGMSFLPLRKGV